MQLLHSYKGVSEGKFTVPIHQMQDFNMRNSQNMKKLSSICIFQLSSLLNSWGMCHTVQEACPSWAHRMLCVSAS